MKEYPKIPGWFYNYAEMLESSLGRSVDIDYDEATRKGMYHFIPLPTHDFLWKITQAAAVYEALHPLKEGWSKEPPINFVDVGGGIGTKAILGQAVLRNNLMRTVRAFNIEYNQKYCELSKHFVNPNYVINKDARLIRGGYSQFDIIYFYCPMIDPKLQRELEKIIYDGSKEGSIHIQIMKMNDSKEQQPLLHKLDCGVFLKTSDTSLIEKAEAALSNLSTTMEP